MTGVDPRELGDGRDVDELAALDQGEDRPERACIVAGEVAADIRHAKPADATTENVEVALGEECRDNLTLAREPAHAVPRRSPTSVRTWSPPASGCASAAIARKPRATIRSAS